MVFTFTIDKVLNPVVPRSVVPRLPQPLARFLGHHPVAPPARHDPLVWIDVLVGLFAGIAVLEAIFMNNHAPVFARHHAPMIIASYGATAILCFNAIAAPLLQPRNILVGHFVSLLIGVCISKLFGLSQGGRDNYWALGALSVAVSSVAMLVLNCVHPPAGALALLPSVDDQVREMSWWYLPAQLILSLVIIAVACLCNNVLRRYPQNWWIGTRGKKPAPPPAALVTVTATGVQVSQVQVSEEELKLLQLIQQRMSV